MLFVDLIGHVKEADVRLYGRCTGMTLDGLDVVIQINVLSRYMPIAVDLLVDLKIDVAEETMVTDSEEFGSIAQRAPLVKHPLAVVQDGVTDDVVHLAHVKGQFCAVFSAEGRAFRDGVIHLELGCHFAVGLNRVCVHRWQAVGMGVVDGRDEVDVEVVLFGSVHRLEAHVIRPFHLQYSAKALLRVAQ